jgi:hypothetical protein
MKPSTITRPWLTRRRRRRSPRLSARRPPLEQRLALAGRGHHRLDDARVADGRLAVAAVDGGLQLGQRVGKTVGRGGRPSSSAAAADALAVHRELGGAGGGDHLGQALGLDLHQHVGGDGLDLRHDQVGLLLLDQRRSAAPSVIGITWARWATWWPGALG